MTYINLEEAKQMGDNFWSPEAYNELIQKDQEEENDMSGATYFEGTNYER